MVAVILVRVVVRNARLEFVALGNDRVVSWVVGVEVDITYCACGTGGWEADYDMGFVLSVHTSHLDCARIHFIFE